MNIAVIGGGISGLSIAQCLKNRHEVKVFEKDAKPGGLVKCDRIQGNLYHMVGGHVFNSRRPDVLDWFWKFFDREKEFTKANRNAAIAFPDGRMVGYPIENHVYQFDDDILKSFIGDLIGIAKSEAIESGNFDEFLRSRFGETLYNLYFRPYNEKIWRTDLRNVSLSWLEGKLPMPNVNDMVYNNVRKIEDTGMVHSTFYYAKNNGSQFLVDRLAEGLDVNCNSPVSKIGRSRNSWNVNGFNCDKVIFCGNIKDFPAIFGGELDITPYSRAIGDLQYHGTTSVLCQIDPNPYSWVYLPADDHLAHRIICTGNFSATNNAPGMLSATVEFTDYISEEAIVEHLVKVPFSPKYIAHAFARYTYPVQERRTREMLDQLKDHVEQSGVFLLGRFAEWEYYNMDAAVGAALDLNERLKRVR